MIDSMVKQVNISFDDEDHAKLMKAKGNMNWRDFIMKLTGDSHLLSDGGDSSSQ